MSNIKKRINKLKFKLKKRGLKLRKDSVLCSMYINGKSDLCLNQIVQRMCEMKYLYDYCDMKNIKTQVYNDYVLNGYVKNYEDRISTQAEKVALKRYSDSKYPKIFPWEKKKLNHSIITNNNKLYGGNELNNKTNYFFIILWINLMGYLFLFCVGLTYLYDYIII